MTLGGALLVIRLVLSAVFAFAGFVKLMDRAGTGRAVRDFGLPERVAGPAALLLPVAELAVAAALLPTSTVWAGSVGAVGLLLLFEVGISMNLIHGRAPDCHCFGQIHSEPIGPSTLVRNAVLAAGAVFIVWFGRSSPGPSAVAWVWSLTPLQVVACLAALLLAAVFAACGWTLLQLVQQNGRLLTRLKAVEARLDLTPTAPRPGLLVGTQAPSFDLQNLDGSQVTLDGLLSRGRPVLLLLSDPVCRSCMALMPAIGRWQRELASALTIVVVSRGTPDENRAEATDHGVSSVLLQARAEVFQAYEVTATPSAVLIQPDGTIGSTLAVGTDEIRAIVSRALALKPPIVLEEVLPAHGSTDLTPSRTGLTVGDVIEATGASVALEPATANIESVRTMEIRSVVEDWQLVNPGDLVAILPDDPSTAGDAAAGAYLRGGLGALTPRAPRLTHERRAPAGPSDAFASLVVPNVRGAVEQCARRWRMMHPEARIIGVTGSVGKSSTREAVASLLSGVMPTLASSSSHNDDLGVALTLLRLQHHHRAAVVEMGMHAAGDIAALAALARPTIGIVTAVAPVHLSRLGSVEAIAAAKAELVRALPADGVAILNGDDPRVRAMADVAQARCEFIGLETDAGWRATEIEIRGLDGMAFTIEHHEWAARIATPLVGRHFLYALLAAAAVSNAVGISTEQLTALLPEVRIEDRQVVLRGANDLVIIDDSWNASLPSMQAALDVLRTIPRRRVAVLGEMLELGAATDEAHREIGQRVGRSADVLIAVGPSGAVLAESACDAGMPAAAIFLVESHADAVQVLTRIVQPGDSILVKGSHALHLERVVHWLLRDVRTDDRPRTASVADVEIDADKQFLGTGS